MQLVAPEADKPNPPEVADPGVDLREEVVAKEQVAERPQLQDLQRKLLKVVGAQVACPVVVAGWAVAAAVRLVVPSWETLAWPVPVLPPPDRCRSLSRLGPFALLFLSSCA